MYNINKLNFLVLALTLMFNVGPVHASKEDCLKLDAAKTEEIETGVNACYDWLQDKKSAGYKEFQNIMQAAKPYPGSSAITFTNTISDARKYCLVKAIGFNRPVAQGEPYGPSNAKCQEAVKTLMVAFPALRGGVEAAGSPKTSQAKAPPSPSSPQTPRKTIPVKAAKPVSGPKSATQRKAENLRDYNKLVKEKKINDAVVLACGGGLLESPDLATEDCSKAIAKALGAAN